ncbi:MAG: metallophosphoesterase, partial [Desulfovibrio sp.]|nr:metallophosphoesterase [Desulfovibrio sp.]
RPDLVCITGDLSDGACSFQAAGGGTRREAALELAALQARLGVFACTGNHEYYSGYASWMAVYREAGIRMLQNEAIALDAGGAPLVLAGLDDPVSSRILAAPARTLAQVFEETPSLPRQAFALVMDHRPGRAFENAAAGASLQLSGHTHGGQCLGMARIVARANRGLVAGWYRAQGMPLYVTAGAGLWPGFPVRLGVPAEIAVIRLARAAGGALEADGKAL